MHIRGIRLLLIGAVCLSMAQATLGAEEYSKGHGALEVFDSEGIAASPLWVQLWVGFMLLMFATGLFAFAWTQPIARWVAGGFVVSALSGELIFKALGLPFLSGSIAIMHLVFWMPGLLFLLIQRPFVDDTQGTFFRIWSGIMTGSILFSFLFDLRDAYRYLAHVIGIA